MENKTFEFKSIFKNELLEFVNYKKSIGYNYDKKTTWLLKIFDDFCIQNNIKEKIINHEVIENWLKISSGFKIKTRQGYYSTIKMFTEFLIKKNYENIVTPLYNPYHGKTNFIPYIFTHEQIENIFEESKKNYNLLYVVLHLFYNCGFRLSEVTNLKLKNFLKEDKSIYIDSSKNNCSRIIPLTNNIYNIIKEYINNQSYRTNEDYIFKNNKSRNALKLFFRRQFHIVLKNVGINKLESGYYPRIHDLRHTFSVHALEQMKDKGFDLYTSLPILSVYLGHKSIVETEHYLRLVPEYNKNVLTSEEYITNLYREKVFYEE